MEKKSLFERKNFLRQKLMSATALLLVASIMMVSSSYAWFVMSTAPEVSNIQTQVGANGALEVALLNSESWNDLSLLDNGDIDESATEQLGAGNLTWGNLVNLADSSYGMSRIVLNPSRLFIQEDGTDGIGNVQYAVNNVLLKTPIYGEDGRIMGLDTESTIDRVCENGQFTAEGYGVRAIGTSATMSSFQLGMNGARSGILTAMSAARTAASNALSLNGSALANIVITYGTAGTSATYSKNDIAAVRSLAVGLQSSLDQIDTALRNAFAGYITTAESGVSSEAYTAALDNINEPDTSLSSLLTAYAGITDMIQRMDSYVNTLSTDQTLLSSTISNCDGYIDGSSESFDWNTVSALVKPLMNTDNMTVNGQTVDALKDSLLNAQGEIDIGAAVALVSSGVLIEVPSDSGVLSDIADFAGDYPAKVTANINYSGADVPLDATMSTKTSANPVYLTVCTNALGGAIISDAVGLPAITDYYGYAIDLAFRTNADDESKLMLQTTPQNRIYADDTDNAAIQGGGSYMSFKTESGISATKMVRLMQGLRVVFMDSDQKILAIAALDCTLGKDAYVVLPEPTSEEYAYLKGGVGESYQISDVISQAEYNGMGESSHVAFDTITGEIKALLYLCNYSMTLNSDGNKTGGTTVGTQKSDQSITRLKQNQPKIVTAMVYLDGSYVTNAMVAANAVQSMTGKLNLQFSSDATLIPAEITKLRSGSSNGDE